MAQSKVITLQELAKHNSKQDCWVAINGKVYDLTSFLDEHPAGSKVILKQAGKDGTEAFEPFHAPDIIQTLGKQHLCVGILSKDQPVVPADAAASTTSSHSAIVKSTKPPLGSILNIFDLERVAQDSMTKEGWAYYSSGADDEVTLRENHAAFSRIWLRPRILRNVSNISLSTVVLGNDVSIPVYVTATALAKLAHKDGEVALTRACHTHKVIQMMPTLASCSLDEMLAARQPGQVQWFQLYVNSNRDVTRKLVEKAEAGGTQALFITVDAPQLGRREKDMRFKFVDDEPDVQKSGPVKRNEGTARAISQFIDPSLNWADIAWFKSITKMPIFLKGVQCGEDAVEALRHGCAGIVVSNHGGRQMDYGRSGIEMLEEVMEALRAVNAPASFEVYVDGGIRRGSDIFKAIALGAKCVGIGRPVLYGLASYGQPGVERVFELLKEELRMCMSLMGCPTIADINPSMVITRNLKDHINYVPKDYLSKSVYLPLKTQSDFQAAQSKL